MRLSLAVVCAALLAGCGPRRTDVSAPVPAASMPPAAAPAIPPGAAIYSVDAAYSVVTLRVYRAGRLAELGHNHVVSSANETGYAWIGGAPGDSGFEVRIPVAGLVVDDPAARAAAGPAFAGDLPAGAREGTRNNMLREEVLDAARHPHIMVRADSLEGTWQQPGVAASVTLKGQTRRIDVPLDIERAADRIAARGAFSILQSDFGITPFSVLGGALQVADRVDVSFEITASRQ